MRPWVAEVMVFLYVILCCKSGISFVTRKKGNNTIIALLPLHTSRPNSDECSSELNLKSAIQSQALVYAVQKINSDPAFKDQISLGLDIEDICTDKPEDLLNVMNTLFKRHKKKEPTAFVVDLSDLLIQLVIHKSRNIPVFSLGSRRQHEGSFIFEPNKPQIGNAVAKLLKVLDLSVFDVLVAHTSDYEYFKEAIKTSSVCENEVFYEKSISGQSLNNDNESFPLLVFSDSLKSLENLPSKLKGRDNIIASNFLKNEERLDERTKVSITLAVKQRVPMLGEFEEFLRRLPESSTDWFGALIHDSTQFVISGELRHGGKVIDAVYTIAHALKNAGKNSISNKDILSMPAFASPTGKQISFSSSKDLAKLEYRVYNLTKQPASLLGIIETLKDGTNANLSLDGLYMDHFGSVCLATCPQGLSPISNSSKCCVKCQKDNSTICEKGLRLSKDGLKCGEVRLDYLKWKHPLSIFIFILVIILFGVLFYLVSLYHKKANDNTILTSKLASMPLLLALFVTLIHPLLPIIKPGTSSCNAYVFGFIQALGIPLCILISRSSSFFKRFREEDGSLKRKVLHSNPQNLIAIFFILSQIILSIMLIAVLPAHVVYYETTDRYVDYIECSTFSSAEFLFPFFYTIILSLFFSITNFRAETNEEDTYESHFTAIFFFLYYMLSFVNIVLVYGVVGKVKVMFLCILGILHLLNFLCFIFFPKVYVMVLKRDPVRFSPFPLMSDTQLLILSLSDQPGIEADPPKRQ